MSTLSSSPSKINTTPTLAEAKSSLTRTLLAPVDIAFLGYFRVAFGALMAWEVWRYLSHGWVQRYWIDPSFHFTFAGFGWLRPWPGDGMLWHFWLMGLLALLIALGLWYRVAMPLFFLSFSYVFLLEKAQYLNHFYLIALLSFLMIFLPAHRVFSLDAVFKPQLKASVTAAWTLWLLRAQLGLVYFYGGIAKLNPDWLRGEPMRMWLAARTDFPLIGRFFTEEWMVYAFSYGGLLFDLAIVPLLLWRRTRPFAFAAAVLFHLINARLFSIGIFPWFMIAATALFFAPSWPRKLTVNNLQFTIHNSPPRPHPLLVILILTFLTLQLLLPLRHLFIPGNVNWTEEGHRFAWHMKLRDKSATEAYLLLDDHDQNQSWVINPYDYLSERQVSKMATRPDMILQFSHYIADVYRADGYENIGVRARVMVSLNGRPPQRLIDPDVDLTQQHETWRPAEWVLPLSEGELQTLTANGRPPK